MLVAPSPFAEPLVRAFARVAIVLVLALAYVRFVEHRGLDVILGTATSWFARCALGAAGFAIYPGTLAAYRLFQGAQAAAPSDPAVWINFLIGSPVAEEVLYRGVLYRVLRSRNDIIRSAALSSVAFALLHVPWRALSGEQSWSTLPMNLLHIFTL